MNPLLWSLIVHLIPYFLLFAVISIGGAIFRYLLWPRIKGKLGEAGITFVLKRKLDPAVYHLIPDIMLPALDGTTQIDHIVVSRYGIFVLEAKTYKGWIFGSEKEAQWTQTIYKRKEKFQNPLRQNYKHIKTLAELTEIPEAYFKSIIVFVGDSTFKTDMPPNVLYLRNLPDFIKAHEEAIILDEQVPEIVAAIREWSGTLSKEQKARHVENLKRNHMRAKAESLLPNCPLCNAPMILRISRKDGKQFWGCPKFPKCRGTRNA